MSSSMQVNHLAENIRHSNKVTFLTSVFKKGLKSKLSNLVEGCITVRDGDEYLSFGDSYTPDI